MQKLLLLIALCVFSLSVKAETIKVMLVTGGHSFDTLQFFQLFDEFDGIEYEHFAQPEANRQIALGKADEFDVLVFYDMWQNISLEERTAYLRLAQEGKPFLFLHHALVSYQAWPEFESIIGGKYVQEGKNVEKDMLSTYEHDVWVYCRIENYTPVTNGFRELRFFDEVYGNVQISDKVKPLLSTTHPNSMPYVAWENHFRNSTVLYIQPGHDKRTYVEKDYRKLLFQAIHYLAKK
ncbi:ThuA domain-containing protein [Maribellus sediminis]|uniref:ThuA domain-containing protein n=1 Tax=Maribellus sediminis TaxID=2696285 RepID=UPI00142FF98E|nr:ThuA domain-containing protein [Maribellus sediminis]